MEISNNTNSILNSNLNTNSSVSEEQKDRFDIFLENQEKDKAENEKTQELLKDIEHVARTGFTQEELELIKKILEEIQKQKAQNGQTPENMEDYLESLKFDLQQAIYEATGKKVDIEKSALEEMISSQNSISNEIFAKPTTDEELRLQDKLKKEFV